MIKSEIEKNPSNAVGLERPVQQNQSTPIPQSTNNEAEALLYMNSMGNAQANQFISGRHNIAEPRKGPEKEREQASPAAINKSTKNSPASEKKNANSQPSAKLPPSAQAWLDKHMKSTWKPTANPPKKPQQAEIAPLPPPTLERRVSKKTGRPVGRPRKLPAVASPAETTPDTMGDADTATSNKVVVSSGANSHPTASHTNDKTDTSSVTDDQEPKRKRIKKEANKKVIPCTTTATNESPAKEVKTIKIDPKYVPVPTTSYPTKPKSILQQQLLIPLTKKPKFGSKPTEGWHEGCIPLAQPEDSEYLTELECLIRENLELFTATLDDIEKGLFKKALQVNRVGTRCVHCRLATSLGHVKGPFERYELATHSNFYPQYFYIQSGSYSSLGLGMGLSSARKTNPPNHGSFGFSQEISGINRVCVTRHLEHFLQHCPYIPEVIKKKLHALSHDKEGNPITHKMLQKKPNYLKYLKISGSLVGMVDTENGGVHFASDPLLVKTGIKPPPSGRFQNTEEAKLAATAITDALSPNKQVDRSLAHLDAESQKTFSEALEGCLSGPHQLVQPEDRLLCTDLKFFLFSQMMMCHVTQEDLDKSRVQQLFLGFTGFTCKYCHQVEDESGNREHDQVEQNDCAGRFFPSTFSSLDAPADHFLNCQFTPKKVKQCIQQLQASHQYQTQQVMKSSHPRFLFIVWCRLRDVDKEGKAAQVKDQPEKSNGSSEEKVNSDGKGTDNDEVDEDSAENSSMATESVDDHVEQQNNEREEEPKSDIIKERNETISNDNVSKSVPSISPADATTLEKYEFVQTPTGWYTCQKCCMVPLDLRAGGALAVATPNGDFLRRHSEACQGDKFDLSVVLRAVEGISLTVPGMKFEDVVHPSFKAIARELVAGNEFLVWAFTDGVKALWYGEANAEYLNPPGLWCLFPPKVNVEGVIKAIKMLPSEDAISGPSKALVSSKYFMDYVHLIAPGFKMPSLAELMN